MTADHDTTRIVRSWLRTDEHESADHILAAVLADVDTTPQRRSAWPARRSEPMNTFAKIAIGAVAVVAVALVGYSLLPSQGGSGGPAATPTPPPTATILPSPTPTTRAFPPAGPLAMGVRYRITLEGTTFTFTVPTADWVSNGEFGIDKTAGVGPDGAGFILWTDTPVGVYEDPCAQTAGPDVGTAIDDLSAAVAAMPSLDLVSGPTDVMVGGHRAKQVTVHVPDDIACPAQSFYLWWAPTPDFARYATAADSTIRTWIIDVDGTPVWFDAETYSGAGPGPASEIQEIVDSIEFE